MRPGVDWRPVMEEPSEQPATRSRPVAYLQAHPLGCSAIFGLIGVGLILATLLMGSH